MKVRFMGFIMFLLTLGAGGAYAEEVAFEFEQESKWAFWLKAKGVAQAGDNLTSVDVLDFEITNNPKHEKNKWIDYVSVGFAYEGNDGGWDVAKYGPKVMINKILKPGEIFKFKNKLSVDLPVSRDQVKKYWAVLVLGTTDGGTIYAHSRANIFSNNEAGPDVSNEGDYFESLSELDLRETLSRGAIWHFERDNFEELNSKAEEFLVTNKRSPSGTWYLTSIESGILGLMTAATTAKEWSNIENTAERWIAADPSKPSGYIAYANSQIFYAWWYMQSKSAVPDLMRKAVFDIHIKKAENFLLEHKGVAAKDPRWYEAMFRVATAQKWDLERFTQLENEAFSKFPYYYQMYFVAFDYHSPMWNGSPEAINSFAKKASRYTAVEDKTGMYARMYWYASQRYYGSKIFTESKVAWDKMSRGIDDVLAQYPDQWNINNFAYFSCLAGDAKKTAKLITLIEPGPIFTVWQDREFFDRCKDWAASANVD